VGTALDTGSSWHRLLRAYLHSAGLLKLSRKWIDGYMAGIRSDLYFAGFAEEADYLACQTPRQRRMRGLLDPMGQP
jgi:15-cis-phytoene synthase